MAVEPPSPMARVAKPEPGRLFPHIVAFSTYASKAHVRPAATAVCVELWHRAVIPRHTDRTALLEERPDPSVFI